MGDTNVLNDKELLDKTLTSIDLNSYIEKMYEIVDDEELRSEFKQKTELTNLRNENYKNYKNIDISRFKNLPDEFSDIREEIISLYDCINLKDMLTDNYEDSKNNQVLLRRLYKEISKLTGMVQTYLNNILQYNDSKQKQLSVEYIRSLDIDENLKRVIIEKYNDLVLFSSKIATNIYDDLNLQLSRKEKIDDILTSLNVSIIPKKETLITDERLEPLNKLIDQLIKDYSSKFIYLEDLMIENSIYSKKLSTFKSSFNDFIAYDDKDYGVTSEVFKVLNGIDIRNYFSDLEDSLISEREEILRKTEVIDDSISIKNLEQSVKFIEERYMSGLSDKHKEMVKYVSDKLRSGNYNLEILKQTLQIVVVDIWKKDITDIYSFDPDKDYCFICSNNQFIDEKYQTILLTKKEVESVTDYEDYQIGFICDYDDNVMYITKNSDIMMSKGRDMSHLKTPKQLENEFINFKACDRIALNGYKTKIKAVYYIDDKNMDKYIKAVELANEYFLPLIVLRKPKLENMAYVFVDDKK